MAPSAVAGAEVNEYEEARRARIAENQRRMQELGIQETVEEMQQAVAKSKAKSAKATLPRKRRQVYEEPGEVRRSGRLQGAVPETYKNDLFGLDALDLLMAPRRRRVELNPESIEAIRDARMKELGVGAEEAGFDSGLGVRLQGGRVYDSKYGVTCHWCRQKTLEEHVECTNEGCGEGRKLPVTFCRMCLMNRHGEDIAQAIASKCWVCPACRGSCGEGCKLCCNCGPCRKKAGLSATHQKIKEARSAGFDNVHDYLVYCSTRESLEAIQARKKNFDWGKWLAVPFDPNAEVEEEEEKAGVTADVSLETPGDSKDSPGEVSPSRSGK